MSLNSAIDVDNNDDDDIPPPPSYAKHPKNTAQTKISKDQHEYSPPIYENIPFPNHVRIATV